MPLARVNGEFGIVRFDLDKDIRIAANGKAWVKMRCVAKDRVRDAQGQWSDGDPCFIDVYVNDDLASHIADSVRQGDQIVVSGSLAMKEWKDDAGNTRPDYRIYADAIGPSMRFATAPSERVRHEQAASAVKAELGAEEVSSTRDDEPPF